MLRRSLVSALAGRACLVSSAPLSRGIVIHFLRKGSVPVGRRVTVFCALPSQHVRHFSSGLPPHTKVALPALSPTMETGTIVSWEKKEGDQLNEGDVLCEIETDKATMGFETPEEGYLAKIVLPTGTKDIPLGKLLCIIVSDPADIPAFKNFVDSGESSASTPAAASQLKAATPPPAGPVATSASNLPSHVKVSLPALSPTMETGTIISWEKKEGDQLGEGDVLCEIETDKATMGFETPEEGYLAKILLPAGTRDIPLGKLLCIIVSDPADIAAFKDFVDTGATTAPAASKAAAAVATADTPASRPAALATDPPLIQQMSEIKAPVRSPVGPAGRVFASPFARMLAAQQGLDLASVVGTGPGGRIVAADLSMAQPVKSSAPSTAVSSAAAAPPLEPSTPKSYRYTDISLTNMRQTIAKRLTESKQQIPHYSLTIEAEVDDLLKLREQLNSTLEDGKLSVNDFIVKAAALACKRVPAANSSFMDKFIREFNAVDVSVAVSTPDGLITPIVFNADTKGLMQISKDTKELAAKAREKKLQPAEFIGGTFTVSNLGMFGIDHFSAIINPPQSCILSVGKTSEVARPCKENGYRIVKILKVTLNCDHRVVDGAVGAQWLQHFRKFLEKPHTMLL